MSFLKLILIIPLIIIICEIPLFIIGIIGSIISDLFEYFQEPEERWLQKRKLVKIVKNNAARFPHACDKLISGVSKRTEKELFSYSSGQLKEIALLDIESLRERESQAVAELERRVQENKKWLEERDKRIEKRSREYEILATRYPNGIIIFRQRNPKRYVDYDNIFKYEKIISAYEEGYKLGRTFMFTDEPKIDHLEIEQYLVQNRIKYLYHFTDRSNLESIRKNGGLYSWSFCEKEHITIDKPGGNSLSRSLDRVHGLEDYVRLAFHAEHPMMYRLRNEGYDLVILRIKVDVAWLKDTLYSNINATDNNCHVGGKFADLKKNPFLFDGYGMF